jgi:hypothetical protein
MGLGFRVQKGTSSRIRNAKFFFFKILVKFFFSRSGNHFFLVRLWIQQTLMNNGQIQTDPAPGRNNAFNTGTYHTEILTNSSISCIDYMF